MGHDLAAAAFLKFLASHGEDLFGVFHYESTRL
jgi:hypothetical protein